MKSDASSQGELGILDPESTYDAVSRRGQGFFEKVDEIVSEDGRNF
jgi:hypothetical protein